MHHFLTSLNDVGKKFFATDVLDFFMLYMVICHVRLPAGLDPSTRIDFRVLADGPVRSFGYDILCLQETHLDAAKQQVLTSSANSTSHCIWGARVTGSSKCGVGMVINPTRCAMVLPITWDSIHSRRDMTVVQRSCVTYTGRQGHMNCRRQKGFETSTPSSH